MTGAEAQAPSSATTLRAGQALGRYQLLCEIARGGMASVYLARSLGMGGFERVVAIKCCHPHLRDDEDFASMFLDEARLAAKIHHPNVVATLDVGEGEALYLVMEYVEGDRLLGVLKAALKRGAPVPVATTLRIAIDALAGLHAAHELKDGQGELLNVVHRDISPHNILVGIDGVTRITDFGVAKAAQRVSVTREGTLKGKVPYMAPELFESAAATRRADLFSMGVVLWESLTGRRLFRGETDAATMKAVLHAEIPPPSSHSPEVPPELDAVVMRALERDPTRRFETAAEFADALEALPVRAASSRAVATYVNEVLVDTLAKRRALIAKLGEAPPVVTSSTTTAVTRLDETRSSQSDARQIWGAGETKSSVDAPPPQVLDRDPTATSTRLPRRARAVWFAAAAAVVVLAGAVAALSFGGGSRGAQLDASHAAARLPATTTTAAATTTAALGTPAAPGNAAPVALGGRDAAPAGGGSTGAAVGGSARAVPSGRAVAPRRAAPIVRRPARGRGGSGGDDFLPGAI